jgi:hypothetical protein
MVGAAVPILRATARAATRLVMPLAYLALALLVYWHLWTPIEGAASTWLGDPDHAPWADLLHWERAWTRGQLGLWNPYDRGGVPVYADARAGITYPVNWLIVWLGGIVGVGSLAMVEAKAVLHVLLGAAGMHVFLRRRGVPVQAAYLGGVIVALTGPAVLDPTSAASASAMWIPWLLVMIDRFAAAPTYRRAVFLAAAWAMCALAGAPAVALAALLVAAPYLAVAMGRRLVLAAPMLAATAAIALLWVAPLWIASLELVAPAAGDGVRAGGGLDWRHAAGILVPGTHASVYAGWLPLAALGALAFARDRRGAVLIALVAIGSASALVVPRALASALAWLAATPELVSRLELYAVTAALAAGAGLGLGALLTVQDEARRRSLARWITGIGVAACLALGGAAAVAAALGESGQMARGGPAWALAYTAGATGLLRGILLRDGRGRAGCAWAAVALVSLDLWGANIEARRAHMVSKPQVRHDHVVAELDGVVDGRYRIFDLDWLGFRPGVRLGVRDFGGPAEDPRASARYAQFRREALEEPALFGHANVRYVLGRPGRALDDAAGMTRVRGGVYELSEVAPAVFYVARPERASGPAEALGALAEIAPGAGAVLEGDVPLGAEGAPAVEGRILELQGGRLVAEITTPGPGVVVVTEVFDPRFEARVGGEPAVIVPANALFRGVAVEGAGYHLIEMRLVPRRYLASLVLYLAALFIVGSAVGSALWRRARRR